VIYDKITSINLERRTFLFAREAREYVDKLPYKITNQEIGRQLIRSAGSVGANYIEANEALSNKDFQFRIKICRKEAKESRYWLESSVSCKMQEKQRIDITGESTKLIKICSTIIKNS
jgi:four helix bundle protein